MKMARLDEMERDAILASLTTEQLSALLADWGFWARPEQTLPDTDWLIWYIETGRGWGKTRTASQAIHTIVNEGHAKYGALLHRTGADVRDIMVEGESGILATAPPGKMPNYEPSKRRITWQNGCMFTCYSAEEPDQLRGPTIDVGWADEFATYKAVTGIDGLTAFDNLLFARRGTNSPHGPRLILTTTPKRVPAVKKMHADALDPAKRVYVTKGSLRDNIANLDQQYVADIMTRYAGTALGGQEIEGILTRTVEGAIFTELMFEATRIVDMDTLPELTTPVVSVDPSSGDGSGDECGICVTALSAGTIPTIFEQNGLTVVQDVRHGYVLEDASMSGPPDAWAQRVVRACDEHNTSIVVAEGNQGGQMVTSVLRNVNARLRVKIVHARVGKEARAQPVATLFAQQRWHLVGRMPDMEDQCTTWVPGKSKKSPDRLDGMVWGAHHLEKSLSRTPTPETSGAWLGATVG